MKPRALKVILLALVPLAALPAVLRAGVETAAPAPAPAPLAIPADPAPPPITDGEPRRIERGSVPLEVTVGAGLVVTTPADVERVALADELLARVTVLSKREVLLNGLAAGRTTLFLWLGDGRRLRYVVAVRRDLGLVERVVRELDERIEVETTADGRSVVLRGEVDSAAAAADAASRAESALRMIAADPGAKVQVLNLLEFPEVQAPPRDHEMIQALAEIDPRIRVRRILGDSSVPDRDAYVLEGRVRTVSSLMRAIVVAERQLGGHGTKIVAADERRRLRDRNLGFGSGATSSGFSGIEPPPPGLVAQLARGLVLTSESGRVVSFLTVDDLAQIQCAIRVLEIDRSRARSMGIDFRIDARNFSIGNLLRPDGEALPALRGQAASVSGVGGNLMGAYVDSARSMIAAIDALEHAQVARSVAEPNILTLSGEEASVLVGGEIPIPTTAIGQVTTIQSFSFREFGIRLDIRPTVDEHDIIALEVSPSIVKPTPGLTAGGVPGFQVQSVQTTARVQAGQSLVIGGLLTLEEGKEERKIPLLGDVPVLKEVFRWHRKTRRERELLFVITPRLVATTGPAEPLELPELSTAPRFGDPGTVEYSLEERRRYDPRNYQLKDGARN